MIPGPSSAPADGGARFPRAEHEGRLARLRAAMRAQAVDAMLLDDSEALDYFTGYDVSLNLYRACIVPLAAPPVMVLRRLDAMPFLAKAWFGEHVGFADTEDPVDAVAQALVACGSGHGAIGYDPHSHALSVAGFARLAAALPASRLIPLPRLPWELRLIKSAAEIARMAHAAALLDRAMADAIAGVAPGVTPRQVTAAAARRLIELGGDPGLIGHVAVARGWDFLHAPLQEAPLARGDVLHLELVCRVGGYDARLMRCVSLGPVDTGRLQAAARLAALQEAQIAAMRPGAAARDVDAVLRDGVLREELRPDYANITGYTLGFYSKASSRTSDFTRTFSPASDWTVEPGMAFHMYTSAQGIAFSETVVVRDHVAERLTKLDRVVFTAAVPGTVAAR